MFVELSLRHSFLKLGLCLLVSCMPLVAMAQFPIVSEEQAAIALKEQLNISDEQEPAFDAAMQEIATLREKFRAEISQAAGSQGVDLQTLLELSDSLQSRSEDLLRGILSDSQLQVYRDINAPKPLSIQG